MDEVKYNKNYISANLLHWLKIKMLGFFSLGIYFPCLKFCKIKMLNDKFKKNQQVVTNRVLLI